MERRKICIVTGTRAEWGLLRPIAEELARRDDCQVQIVATNMHLDPRFGHTIDEITQAGFAVDATVDMIMPGSPDNEATVARATARCMSGMVDAFQQLAPDAIVVLGDRSEILAVASAATIMRIPLIHLHGGEITEGAIDDAIRHAVTKLSSLHLVSTESHRRRVIQMGEQPDMVINTGAIGVYNALHTPPVTNQELIDYIGFLPDKQTIFVTYHPATLDSVEASSRFDDLLKALDRFPQLKIIFSFPNNDARGAGLIDRILRYAATSPERIKAIPSLGMRRYMSMLPKIAAAVGNSSSGIIEVPSAGIPSVDIGIRQRGRTAGPSVIHCGDSTEEIATAIERALSPQMQQLAARRENPYAQPDTLGKCVTAIATTPLDRLRHKTFHDLNQRSR